MRSYNFRVKVGAMNLVRLLYASRFCESKYESTELARINESSQKNNVPADVTGILIFGEDYFLQCLEGGREAVSTTFNRITRDPRHEKVLLLSMEEITHREFGEWVMKFVVLTKANGDLIREFSTTSRFNPFTMHAKNAFEMMKALKK